MTVSKTVPKGRVLVVEDEASLREAIVTFLNMDGLSADGVGSLQAAALWLNTHEVDVVVLDLGLPDGEGLEWVRRMALQRKGVVICSARSYPADRVAGMRAGADAYLVKPVDLDELSLLIGRLVNRLKSGAEQPWIFQRLHWTLRCPQGNSLKLTRTEAVAIECLAQVPGNVISKDNIVVALGHDPVHYDVRRLEVMIRRLRAKSQSALGIDLPLQTVNRMGYVFASQIRIDH